MDLYRRENSVDEPSRRSLLQDTSELLEQISVIRGRQQSITDDMKSLTVRDIFLLPCILRAAWLQKALLTCKAC
jgi:hypothetical protein